MTKVFENITELTESFFQEILFSLNQQAKINIAISGGTTPAAIFELLAKNYSDKLDWKRINFFWVDERCVPSTHTDSNYGMTKKTLLNHIIIPPKNIHPIYCEENVQAEIERYSEEIKLFLPMENKFPRFDLIFLGLGSDGHTASIFPDQIELMKSKEVCAVSIQPESKQKRITLTGKIINNSKKIIFIVTGKSKSLIIKNIFEKRNEIRFPAEHIKPIDGTLYWFLDKEAASLL
jgi:6-phosphogluconolactonase